MPKRSSKKLIDTNLIIRFLAQDTPDQAIRVESLIKSAKPNSLVLTDVIITEIIHVLQSVYEEDKDEIIRKILALLDTEAFDTNESLIRRALGYWAEHTISFVDAYLCAQAKLTSQTLYTYDKRLQKVSDITAQEPK